MHNGWLDSLGGVIEFYSRGGVNNKAIDPLFEPLNLHNIDVSDIVEFLLSLTSSNAKSIVSDAFATNLGGQLLRANS